MSGRRSRDAQLELFEDAPPPDPSSSTVAPAASIAFEAERARDAALAPSIPAHVRFGTSSWTFRGWSTVYQRSYGSERVFTRDSLAEYAEHPLFGTVGIDRSHYAPIPEPDLEHYATLLPLDFPVVMKVWDELTALSFPDHARYGARRGQRNEHAFDLGTFEDFVLGPVERALGARLGCFVLEIPPPSTLPEEAWFLDRLDRFLAAFGHRARFAVELRDRRLLTREYASVLHRHRAAVTHCQNHWSRMPRIGAQAAFVWPGATPAPAFRCLRLLLPPGTSYEEQRARFAPFDRVVEVDERMRIEVIQAITEDTIPTFVLVNNKAEGSAPLTIRGLVELLEARRRGTHPQDDDA